MIAHCKRIAARAQFQNAIIGVIIAVVINNLEKAREHEQRVADASSPEHELLARVAALRREIEELDSALRMKALQR